jgi:hypothetical protein
MTRWLEVDDEGDLWLRTGDADGYEGSTLLGPIEEAEGRVPAGLEDLYAHEWAAWRDRFDAGEEARASWWRGQRC